MKKILTVSLIAGLGLLALPRALPAMAQDHLEPDHSILGADDFDDQYHVVLRQILKDAYRYSVVVRMVETSVMGGDRAIGIISAGANFGGPPYRIFYLKPSTELSEFESDAVRPVLAKREKLFGTKRGRKRLRLSDAPKRVHAVKCEVGLKTDLARKIIKDWASALTRNTHYPRNFGGMDGGWHHFYAEGLAAVVWSPDAGTVPGKIVAVAYAMMEVCEKKASLSDLEKASADLEKDLR